MLWLGHHTDVRMQFITFQINLHPSVYLYIIMTWHDMLLLNKMKLFLLMLMMMKDHQNALMPLFRSLILTSSPGPRWGTWPMPWHQHTGPWPASRPAWSTWRMSRSSPHSNRHFAILDCLKMLYCHRISYNKQHQHNI